MTQTLIQFEVYQVVSFSIVFSLALFITIEFIRWFIMKSTPVSLQKAREKALSRFIVR